MCEPKTLNHVFLFFFEINEGEVTWNNGRSRNESGLAGLSFRHL